MQILPIHCCLLAACLLPIACASSEPSPAEKKPAQSTLANTDWPAFVIEFLEADFKANPAMAVEKGRHEFDGQLPDWTDVAIQRHVENLRKLRQRALAFDEKALDDDERFEREYLLARIDNDLFWIDVAQVPFRNPQYYIDALNPSVYVVRMYAPPEARLRAFIKYAKSVADAAPHIRENLRTPMPTTYLKYGIAGFQGLADFYRKDVRLAFKGVGDAVLQKHLVDASDAAAAALSEIAAWLEGELPRGTGPDPLGPERYAQMLKMTERVEIPVAQLETACRADLERNTKALHEACGELAPGVSIEKCMEQVSAKHPKGGAVAAARDQLVELREFVVDHDVVSIPGPEEAGVAEAPAFNRQNFAYIEIPGPYEKNLPSIYYIAPPDPSWTQEEQDAYVGSESDLLFTSAHEVWPGHFLQYVHANRVKSPIGRVYVGYAFAEGWAHYAEEMMWEKGLRGDPETHIGQLTNALLRDVRMLSSIGLHTKGMTVEESEKMFRELAFQDPGNARQQAARGTYDPGYLNYTLGKLMIRKLRADWTATRGGVKAWKQFHDTFLSYGGPPIPLVRRAMLPGDKGPVL